MQQRYVRKPELDRRIERGDGCGADAWLDTETGRIVFSVIGWDRVYPGVEWERKIRRESRKF